MSSQPLTFLTPEEYLAAERKAEHRSEYLNGEVFAMSGASRNHARIVRNLSRRLDEQLESGPCEAYTNDVRVRIDPAGSYLYPDVVVICGEPGYEDANRDSMVNPTVVIEVLSPSTEPFDRGKKFALYSQLETLTDYLLVAQDQVHVEHFVRQPGGEWLRAEKNSLDDVVELPSVGAKLKLSEVYRSVFKAV
jgi:Uma2 family endonuclease